MKNTLTLTGLFLSQIFRDKDSNSFKKITGILSVYLFTNFILAYSYFRIFDKDSYIFFTISLSAFYLGFVILNDFRNIFFLDRDAWIVRGLPVSKTEITSAKILSSLAFSGVAILILLIPSVYFFLKYSEGISESISFIIITFEFTLTFCFFLMLLFAVSLKSIKSSTLLFTFFQILFFVFIFASTGYRRTGYLSERINVLSDGIFVYFPQILYVNSVNSIPSLIVTTILFVAIMIVTVSFISKNLYNFSTESSTSAKKNFASFKKILTGYINSTSSILNKHNSKKEFYKLVWSVFRNSKEMRLKLITLITLPVIFALVGFYTGAVSFLDRSGLIGLPFASEIKFNILSPAILILLIFSTLSLIKILKTSDSNNKNISWIFRSFTSERKYFVGGALNFIITGFLAPVCIILCIIFSFQSDMISVLLNLIFVFSILVFIISMSFKSFKDFPFTKDGSFDNPIRNFSILFISLILAIIIFSVQIFIFQNIIFVMMLSVLLLAISIKKLNG